MKRYHLRDRSGQVLITVALALLVLIGVVALAVDGGNVYAERRKMQNAADAGALAGARALCLQNASDSVVEAVAQEYAIDLNGAHGAEVTISGPFTVTVVATETAQTFFARAIGFPEIEVQARASAMCQGPSLGAGLWPLAVGDAVYDESCVPNADNHFTCINCGEMFFAYIGDPDISVANCVLSETTIVAKSAVYGECDTEGGAPMGLPNVDEVQHLDSSSRGWLDLQVPLEPYPDYCKNASCGVPNVQCWLEYGHPGPIEVGDCIYTEEGGQAVPLGTVINGECDEIHNLLLFNRTCDERDETADPPVNWYSCGTPQTNDFYKISGFGCMRVVGFYEADFVCPALTSNTKKIPVAIVQKMCQTWPDGTPMDRYEECTALAPGTGNPADIDDYIVIQLTE